MRVLAAAVLSFVMVRSTCALDRSGAAFLNIGQGARAMGLANAFTTVADPTSMFHNVAGISMVGRSFNFTHQQLFADIRTDSMGYTYPTPYGVFGSGLIYLSQGALEGRDASGQQTGNFTSSDLAFSLLWASKLSALSPIRIGGGVKLIQQKIATDQATGFAVDAGIQSNVTPLFSLGASVQNVGPQMKFVSESFSLPMTIGVGAGYLAGGLFSVYADEKFRPYDHRNTVSVGTEYWILPVMVMRAGYLALLQGAVSGGISSSEDRLFNSNSGLGMGLGIKIRQTTIDYAFTPAGDLGDVHRITLAMRFGGLRRAAAEETKPEPQKPNPVFGQ